MIVDPTEEAKLLSVREGAFAIASSLLAELVAVAVER
jgi:hypothetical protein